MLNAETITARAVGIDSSKDSFTVCLISKKANGSNIQGKHKNFANTQAGIEKFEDWIKRQKKEAAELRFVIEATGVYYEAVAYYLAERDYYLSVLLANKARSFARSYDIKSKTDAVDATLLGQMGAERNLPRWHIPDQRMHELKQLCREHQDLAQSLTVINNRLHALRHGVAPCQRTIQRYQARQQSYQQDRKMILQEIQELVDQSDQQLREGIQHLISITGVA